MICPHDGRVCTTRHSGCFYPCFEPKKQYHPLKEVFDEIQSRQHYGYLFE